MYARIYNYAPQAMPDALSTYYQTGMGAVLTPEALVVGEDFARTAGQMAGLVNQPVPLWKGLLAGVALATAAPRVLAWFAKRR